MRAFASHTPERMRRLGKTNRRRQELLRRTAEPGTDHNSKIWILRCRDCQHVYGSNSTDAFERRCPKCQEGRSGLPVPAERDGKDWTREEHVIAFKLYNEIPFGTIHMRNPKVIELAALLGRSVGSVSYKLANFARNDPSLRERGIRGMPRGAKGEVEIWNEFSENPERLTYESTRLLAGRLGKSIEETAEIEETELPPPGREREALVRLRVSQGFFRNRVLSAYNFQCCITGLGVEALLVASHIIPWSRDPANRLNPRNGLCLNALHDRAFDRRLMWVEDGLRIRFAPELHERAGGADSTLGWLISFEGACLRLPGTFLPDAEFLRKHAWLCKRKRMVLW
jgi:putative restriction endonuclease